MGRVRGDETWNAEAALEAAAVRYREGESGLGQECALGARLEELKGMFPEKLGGWGPGRRLLGGGG